MNTQVAARKLRQAAWTWAHLGAPKDYDDREGRRAHRALLKAAIDYAKAHQVEDAKYGVGREAVSNRWPAERRPTGGVMPPRKACY